MGQTFSIVNETSSKAGDHLGPPGRTENNDANMSMRTMVAMGGALAGLLWGGPALAAEKETGTWPRFRGPAGSLSLIHI